MITEGSLAAIIITCLARAALRVANIEHLGQFEI
jgi:hypothetical protein